MRRAGVRPGEVRARLLKATEEIIQEQGSSAVSLREVARRAGVSHGAPAHHFGNKAGLLSSVAANGFAELRDAFAAAVRESNAKTAVEVMRATGTTYARFATSRPGWFELVLRRDLIDRDTEDYMRAVNSTYGVLMDVIRRCEAEGLITEEEVPVVSVLCWSVVIGFGALWNSGAIKDRNPDVALEPLLESCFDYYVKHIVPSRKSAGRVRRAS